MLTEYVWIWPKPTAAVTECRTKWDASYSMLDFAPASYRASCLQCCVPLKELETTVYDCRPFPLPATDTRQPGHANPHRLDRRHSAGVVCARGGQGHRFYR